MSKIKKGEISVKRKGWVRRRYRRTIGIWPRPKEVAPEVGALAHTPYYPCWYPKAQAHVLRSRSVARMEHDVRAAPYDLLRPFPFSSTPATYCPSKKHPVLLPKMKVYVRLFESSTPFIKNHFEFPLIQLFKRKTNRSQTVFIYSTKKFLIKRKIKK